MNNQQIILDIFNKFATKNPHDAIYIEKIMFQRKEDFQRELKNGYHNGWVILAEAVGVSNTYEEMVAIRQFRNFYENKIFELIRLIENTSIPHEFTEKQKNWCKEIIQAYVSLLKIRYRTFCIVKDCENKYFLCDELLKSLKNLDSVERRQFYKIRNVLYDGLDVDEKRNEILNLTRIDYTDLNTLHSSRRIYLDVMPTRDVATRPS